VDCLNALACVEWNRLEIVSGITSIRFIPESMHQIQSGSVLRTIMREFHTRRSGLLWRPSALRGFWDNHDELFLNLLY